MDSPSRKWRFSLLFRALFAQIFSAIFLWGVFWLLKSLGMGEASMVLMLFIQGIFAAALGKAFGLTPWWLIFQLFLPAALAVGVWASIPSWANLAVFLILLLVYWNSAHEKVPLYLSNQKTWIALAGILPKNNNISFIDLGCGLGGVLSHLAKVHPQGHFVGIETAPIPFLISWLRMKLFGPQNVRVLFKDIWKVDLSSYDVAYSFLSPAPMAQLFQKVCAEMKPGSLFISNSFNVPGLPADKVIIVEDRRKTNLHIYIKEWA